MPPGQRYPCTWLKAFRYTQVRRTCRSPENLMPAAKSRMRCMPSRCTTSRARCPWRDAKVKRISPTDSPAVTRPQSLSPSFRVRLCWARSNQSSGVPRSRARTIKAMMSATRSARYTSRVVGVSPIAAGLGDAGRGLGAQALDQPDRAPIASGVSQISAFKFRGSSAH